jgi:hypothetical protein
MRAMATDRLIDRHQSAFARATTQSARRVHEDVRQRKGKVKPPSFFDWSLRIKEPKAGRLDFDRFPFQRELYAETHDDLEAVVVKATQIGISAYLVRWTLYWSDIEGWTVVYVFPKAAQMYDFSDTRVKELIDGNGYLRGRVPRAAVQNKGLKHVGRGFIYYRGSESTDGLESIDADAIALDEYDSLVAANIPVVERRLTGSLHGLIRRVGVPSVPGFGLDALYRKTDMRRWWVPCGKCKLSQPIFYDRQHSDSPGEAVNGYVDEDKLRVVCGNCGTPLVMEKGSWVAEFPDRGVRGYQASRLIVPAVARNDRGTLEKIVTAAHDTEPYNKQVHYNRDRGEAYAPSEGRLSLEALQAAQRDDLFTVPGYEGMNLVTMGIDVASARALNVRISEHLSETTKRALWVGQVEKFDTLNELMARYTVHMAAIDHLPEGRLSRSFCERFAGRAYRVIYSATAEKVISVNEEERSCTVRRTEAIDAMMQAIREQRNLLPRDLPEGYVEHMQAPVRFLEKNDVGKIVVGYRNSGPDDYAHAEVYDLVARELWAYRIELDEYTGVLQPLEERYEFERSHLGDHDAFEEAGHFGLGPGVSSDYSPGFDE